VPGDNIEYHTVDTGYHTKDAGYHTRDTGYHTKDTDTIQKILECSEFREQLNKAIAVPKPIYITNQNVSTNTGIALLGGKRTLSFHSIRWP